MEAMQHPQAEPLLRSRREEIQILNLHPDCLAEVAVEYPLLQAVYEVRRYGLPTEEVQKRRDETIKEHGQFTVLSASVEPPVRDLENVVRHVARHANWLSHETDPRSCERSFAKGPSVTPGRGSKHVPEYEISTPPERFRFMDRQRLNFRLFAQAEKLYEKSTGEKLAHWQRTLFSRYCRNLALVDQNLIATLFDQTVAARAIVDDNFAWELWQLVFLQPVSKGKFRSDDCQRLGRRNLGEHEADSSSSAVAANQIQNLVQWACAEGKREKAPGEWAQQFEGKGICSYPPEDIVLENYGLFLKKKGKSVLSRGKNP